MTTLLQEFEEWLKQEYEQGASGDDYGEAIFNAREKLKELKKKHNVV